MEEKMRLVESGFGDLKTWHIERFGLFGWTPLREVYTDYRMAKAVFDDLARPNERIVAEN